MGLTLSAIFLALVASYGVYVYTHVTDAPPETTSEAQWTLYMEDPAPMKVVCNADSCAFSNAYTSSSACAARVPKAESACRRLSRGETSTISMCYGEFVEEGFRGRTSNGTLQIISDMYWEADPFKGVMPTPSDLISGLTVAQMVRTVNKTLPAGWDGALRYEYFPTPLLGALRGATVRADPCSADAEIAAAMPRQVVLGLNSLFFQITVEKPEPFSHVAAVMGGFSNAAWGFALTVMTVWMRFRTGVLHRPPVFPSFGAHVRQLRDSVKTLVALKEQVQTLTQQNADVRGMMERAQQQREATLENQQPRETMMGQVEESHEEQLPQADQVATPSLDTSAPAAAIANSGMPERCDQATARALDPLTTRRVGLDPADIILGGAGPGSVMVLVDAGQVVVAEDLQALGPNAADLGRSPRDGGQGLWCCETD